MRKLVVRSQAALSLKPLWKPYAGYPAAYGSRSRGWATVSAGGAARPIVYEP